MRNHPAVNTPSRIGVSPYGTRQDPCLLASTWVYIYSARRHSVWGTNYSRRCTMGDVGFVLLTIALFAVLALTVRGAERL